MAMARYRHILLLLFVVLLLVKPYTFVQCQSEKGLSDEYGNDNEEEYGEEEEEEYEDVDPTYDDEEEEEFNPTVEDDGDVVGLGEANFNETIENNDYVMVEFYASWCDHCKEFAPTFREIAAFVKKDNIVLARLEGQSQYEIAERYSVDGFPMIYFFKRGVPKLYKGARSKEAIIEYLKKQLGPSVFTANTIQEAEDILQTYSVIAFEFISDLKSAESLSFIEACDYDDDVYCVQSSKEEVAQVFQLPKHTKPPALVLLKNDEEKFNLFEGEFSNTTISNFFKVNLVPLIVTYSQETSDAVFGKQDKNQIILFAGSEQYKNVLPIYQTVAKKFKSKLFFVYINTSDTKEVESISQFFGIRNEEAQIRGFKSDQDGIKYRLTKELNVQNLEEFASGVLNGTVERYYKSAPIPENNDDDDVIEVVGETFEQIVMDESKDVLFEIYAPWCGHCQRLEPIYKKLGQRFKNVKSMVIAKFDGNTNEHPLVHVEGYPMLLFYPAFNKTQPMKVTEDRTLKPLTKFLKENAAIPFTLPKKGELASMRSTEEIAEEKELKGEDKGGDEANAKGSATGHEEL